MVCCLSTLFNVDVTCCNGCLPLRLNFSGSSADTPQDSDVQFKKRIQRGGTLWEILDESKGFRLSLTMARFGYSNTLVLLAYVKDLYLDSFDKTELRSFVTAVHKELCESDPSFSSKRQKRASDASSC